MSVAGPELEERLRRAAPAAALVVIDGFEPGSALASGAGADTIFQAGSVSKPVAALVALRLVEAGVLELDVPVNQRLRSWQIPDGHGVTLSMLLAHTSGLGVDFFPGYRRGTPVPSLAQVLDGQPPASTPPVRLEGRPGAAFRYSGGGYAVLQLLVSEVTGTPFPAVAAEVVFEPLGMRRSTFEQPLPAELRKAAAGRDWHLYPEAAAAGLWTAASDLAAFAVSIQRALASLGGPVSHASASLMVEPATPLPGDGEWSALSGVGIEPPQRFGLGLFLNRCHFSHLGGSAGFFCGLWASLRDGTGAVLMTNQGPSPAFFDVVRTVADAYGWPHFRAED